MLARIAVVGVALGVVVIVMAISILQGFRDDITSKVVGFGSHLTLSAYGSANSYTETPVALDTTLLARIRSVAGVRDLQAYATKGGMVKTDNQIYGIVLRGYGDDCDTAFFHRSLVEGQLPFHTLSPNDVLISTTIAAKLNLHVGDKMPTYFWQGDSYRPRALRVCGLYNTDLADMDRIYVVGNLAVVQRLNDWDSTQAGGYEISLASFDQLATVQAQLAPLLPYDLMLTSVRDAQPALFSWLDLLDANILLLLVIMGVVSAVCVVSALLIMIFEKSATIGLLKALGASDAAVRRIFLRKASTLIAWGILIGNIISLLLCFIQSQWHPLTLDPDSYSMSVVPVSISPATWLLVSLGTFAVCLLATLLPAALTARIRPAITLRSER